MTNRMPRVLRINTCDLCGREISKSYKHKAYTFCSVECELEGLLLLRMIQNIDKKEAEK